MTLLEEGQRLSDAWKTFIRTAGKELGIYKLFNKFNRFYYKKVYKMTTPKFTYLKTPLNKYTFKMPKIRHWVESQMEGRVLNLFAGMTELNYSGVEVRNDIRESMNAEYHMDAIEFVKSWKGEPFDTIILDPAYSYRKCIEMYEGSITSPFNALKDYLLDILTEHGKIITFGYHSVSQGMKRGFVVEEICVLSHGGAIHDTIATVERRI